MNDIVPPSDDKKADAVRILNNADVYKIIRFPNILDKVANLSLSNEPTLLITATPGTGVDEALRTLLGRDAPEGHIVLAASEGGVFHGPEQFIARKKCIPILEKAGVQMNGIEAFKKYMDKQNATAR